MHDHRPYLEVTFGQRQSLPGVTAVAAAVRSVVRADIDDVGVRGIDGDGLHLRRLGQALRELLPVAVADATENSRALAGGVRPDADVDARRSRRIGHGRCPFAGRFGGTIARRASEHMNGPESGGDMRLAGKVALISGGARGMGAAEAKMFAREGAQVVIGDVLEDEGRAVEAEVAAKGGKAAFVRLDVTREADWQQAVALAEQRFGKLNVLVNNAGISAAGRVEDTSLEAWQRVMDVNATGVFLGTKAAIPAMRRADGGSIVNISSQLGLVGTDITSPMYPASKGAVRLLTKVTAIQYAKERIRANSVHPGPIVTAMTEKRRADPETYKLMLSRIPLGRYGEPEEVAYAVLYLASDESAFVTGSELVIDGGWTAQ